MPVLFLSEDKLRGIITEEVTLAILLHESDIAQVKEIIANRVNASDESNKPI